MMKVAKLWASCGGVGKLRGGGTVAALFFILLWYFTAAYRLPLWAQLVFVLLIFFTGVVVSTRVEKEWGHDSNRVVIDEVSGMSISVLALPYQWYYFLFAFLLFRFFDIVKPLYIRRVENFRGGWGVMLDDVLAGIYSLLTLHLLIRILE